jgi:hypothetical protein
VTTRPESTPEIKKIVKHKNKSNNSPAIRKVVQKRI